METMVVRRLRRRETREEQKARIAAKLEAERDKINRICDIVNSRSEEESIAHVQEIMRKSAESAANDERWQRELRGEWTGAHIDNNYTDDYGEDDD